MQKVRESRTARRFPKVSESLKTALGTDATGQGSLRQTRRSIARKLRVNIETVDSWRRGVRCIPEEKIEPLVRALGHELPGGALSPEGLELIQTLKAARENDEPISWKERLDEGHYLQVEQARYGGAGRFWGRIFFPFLDAACILHSADERSRNFYELQRAVWSGKLDVALGILATPQLSLKLWFFESPIHYRLNGIVLSEGDVIGITGRVRDALARPEKRKRIFVPIIMKGEVGAAYACQNLGLIDPVWVGSLSAEEFCNVLLSNAVRSDGRIPLIVVDEVTCLSTLIKLEGRGKLIFPLVSNPGDRELLVPPSFPLGLCVSRNERVGHAKRGELMSFIRDALPAYIRGNAQAIAHSYVALHNQVRRLVDRALPDCSSTERETWIARTFGLDRASLSLEPPHWRAVLYEARIIMEKDTEYLL